MKTSQTTRHEEYIADNGPRREGAPQPLLFSWVPGSGFIEVGIRPGARSVFVQAFRDAASVAWSR